MDVIHPRCAGLDISKRDATICVRINGAGRRKTTETVTTFGATTRQIVASRDHLAEQKVTCVVMEATGDYWKPFHYLLEDVAGGRGLHTRLDPLPAPRHTAGSRRVAGAVRTVEPTR
ncbi:hypothetical protein MSAR_48170 [Mycolicibacterium sarraceniae]|uniref:IS110 family transposase n=1 Tax=Mycolicibacterium sarraceniae TaxID=1534348 RepID=A0A7I7SZG0_9MYCO|nr:hypothetical protein MSAR_48170 [Mycolicibacterium sarraceniae]